MKSDIIYSLINNDIFRQDVMKYLEIETDKNFEITESEDFNEDNDFLKLFISTNKKNYLITVEIINDDYKFVGTVAKF